MGEHLVTERHALGADEDAGAGDQAHLALLLAAERAAIVPGSRRRWNLAHEAIISEDFLDGDGYGPGYALHRHQLFDAGTADRLDAPKLAEQGAPPHRA